MPDDPLAAPALLSLAVLWWFVKAFFAFTIHAVRYTIWHHERTVFGWE